MVKRGGFEFGRNGGHLARLLGRGERFAQRGGELILGGGDFDWEAFGQSASRESEGARGCGAGWVLGLCRHSADPFPHGLRRRLAGHAARQVIGEFANPVVEDRDEEFMLPAKVSVKSLVGEAGLGEDCRDFWVEDAGPLDHREGGLDQAGDLVLGGGTASFEAPGHRLAGDGPGAGGVERCFLGLRNVVLHTENGILRSAPSQEVDVTKLKMGGELLIGDILRRASETVPENPAATVGETTLRYGELERDANRLAYALRTRLGIKHGDRVAGWADTSAEVLPLFVALAKLGAVFAPLNARLGAAEAGEVASLARATVLIADSAHASGAAEVARLGGIDRWALLPIGSEGRETASVDAGEDADRLILDAISLQDPDASIEEPALRETDPHVIFFTSGSTGRPKGVVLSHRANWLRAFQGVFRDEPERTVCAYPLFHMAAFTLAMAAWQTRGEITYTAATAEALLGAVERRRATRLNGIPLLWKRIIESDISRFDVSSLEQLDTGTSATPIELIRQMKTSFPKACIRIFYGSTEVGSAMSLMDLDILRKPGAVGIPSNNVDVRLAEDGEIEVRSPYLMDGYFDDPETTAAVMRDGWFAMGDMGAQDDEGYYSIVGRKKEILRTGGENVSPNEVEGVLREFPGVQEIAIVGLPDPSWGDLLCAAVVLAPDAKRDSISLARIQEYCEGRLAGFKKPRRLAVLDALPRTSATNQVQRTLLVEKIVAEGLATE